MENIPTQLNERLNNIFTKEEIKGINKAFSLEKRPVTFRVNTLKSTAEEIEEALSKASITYTKLNFPKNCYLLDSNFSESDLWKLKIYKHGKIYMQGISSQIPVHIFDTPKDSTKTLRILDATAAPGGKTSQLVELYPDAEIYAFESSKIRYEKMRHNFVKLGIEIAHAPITINSRESDNEIVGEFSDGLRCINDSILNISNYIEEENYFDLVIIDAPCSGEGSISLSNTKFLENWNISYINKNYRIQKQICDAVLPYLKENGEMIYSTCTLAPEENESVIHYLLCHYPELTLDKIDFQGNKYIKTKEALKVFGKHPYKKDVSESCLRVIPSEFSEGFFIAKLQKGA